MSSASSKGVERPIRLALCETRAEDSEWLIAALRNAGVASRPFPCSSLADLSRLLTAESLDAVVIGEDWSAFTPSAAKDLVAPQGVSVVVATGSLSPENYEALRVGGVDDIYVRGMPALACRVIQNQAALTELRRASERAQAALADTDRRVDAIIEVLVDPIAYLNEGLHVKANQAYLDLMGMATFDDLEGLSLLDMVAREDAASLREKIKKLGRGQGEAEDLLVHLASAPEKAVVFNLAPAFYDGEPCLQVTVRGLQPVALSTAAIPAITADVGVAAAVPQPVLDEWMRKDAATNLFNRNHVLEQIRSTHLGSLWLIQVDHHEAMLRNIGASRLDDFMASLGRRLTDLSGEDAIIGRWTENTVAVLLPYGDEVARSWAQRIRSGVSSEFLEFGGRSLSITISMGGVALSGGLNADEVLSTVNAQLSEALSLSNELRYFDPDSEKKARLAQNQARVQAIQQAVSENRLFLAFQPIISLTDGRPCYESLVRLRTLDNKVETPMEFMPLAEEFGAAEEIDLWVLNATLEKAAQRHGQGKNSAFLFKLSTSSVRSGKLPGAIAAASKRLGIAPSDLWVEIPLAAAISYAREARTTRDELVALGCHVVLAGLPTDPAALRMVSLMDPEWVKTNKDVTAGLGNSSEKQAALKTMVNTLHQEKRRLITGFVEDASSLGVLFTLGVDAMQGNFISMALPDTSFDFSQFGF